MVEIEKINEEESVEKKFNHSYPLIEKSELSEETTNDIVEMIATASEKYPTSYENAAKYIKFAIEKSYGPAWNVVLGETFATNVVYVAGSFLFLYIGGKTACLIWKAPSQ